MKKLLLLLPLIIVACKEEKMTTETSSIDSVNTPQIPVNDVVVDSASIRDSLINNAPKTKQVLQDGVMRSNEEGEIVRELDATMLPIKVGEEFTSDNQKLILKVANFSGKSINVNVKPEKTAMNIRVNQIILPDGTQDGPFGREVANYQVSGKGVLQIIISKSSMASGTSKGHFTVEVE